MIKIAEVRQVSVAEVAAMGSMCAWQGCARTFEGDMPGGWTWLVTYWSPDAEAGKRLLCPTHAAELEHLLKDVGNQFKDVAGSA